MKKVRISAKEFDMAVRNLEDEAYERFGNTIHVIVDKPFDEEPIEVLVSCVSVGAQSLDEAADFARKIQEAIELAKAFPYSGSVPHWDAEAGEIYYEIETEDDDDNDIIDNDDDDEDTFIIGTEIETKAPSRWSWYETVIIADKRNLEDGTYETEGKTAELAAFEAVSIIDGITDDYIRPKSGDEAIAAYEEQLDAVARIMAYNQTCQKWCIDDIMPKLSIKVTMYMIPNDGELYEDEETIMAACDDVTGAVVYDESSPSRGISMTCREWELVEGKARAYSSQADDGIVQGSIEN